MSWLSRGNLRFRTSGFTCCSYLGAEPDAWQQASKVLENALALVWISSVNPFHFYLTNIYFVPAVWHNWGKTYKINCEQADGSLPSLNFHLERETSIAQPLQLRFSTQLKALWEQGCVYLLNCPVHSWSSLDAFNMYDTYWMYDQDDQIHPSFYRLD